jgi:hypothetical protein
MRYCRPLQIHPIYAEVHEALISVISAQIARILRLQLISSASDVCAQRRCAVDYLCGAATLGEPLVVSTKLVPQRPKWCECTRVGSSSLHCANKHFLFSMARLELRNRHRKVQTM